MKIELRNVDLLRSTFQVYQLTNVYKSRGGQSFRDRRDNLISTLRSQYKNYSKEVDREVFEALIELYAEKIPEKFAPGFFKDLDAAKLSEEVRSEQRRVGEEW